MNQFKGVFPALLTPFLPDGKVDTNALQQVVSLHLSQGVKGFYITGSTAECHLLSLEERMEIAEIVRSLTRGKALVIGHVGTASTDFSCQLAKHAAKIGLDAVSSLPPLYYRYSFEEIYRFYQSIIDASGLPAIVYNFPALSGVSFTLEQYRKFAENEKIIGIKYTSPDLYGLNKLKAALPQLTVYNGHDEIMLGGLAMGADGAIGSTFNFAYPIAQRILHCFQAEKLQEAQAWQNRLNEILKTVLEAGNYQATKYLMRKYGISCGGCRKPMKDLTEDQLVKLDKVMELLDV